jgi:hypothetical protein
MSKTRAEVIEQALRNLMVIAEGQAVSDSDVQKLDLIVDGVCAEMAALKIFYVADTGQIGPTGGDFDDAAYLSIADYLAWRGLSTFPMGEDGQARITGAATQAEAILRALSGAPRGRRELKFDTALRARARASAPFPNNF